LPCNEHVAGIDRFRKTEGEGPDEGWFCSASAAAQYEPVTWKKRQLLGQENGGYMMMMACFFFLVHKNPWGSKNYILLQMSIPKRSLFKEEL